MFERSYQPWTAEEIRWLRNAVKTGVSWTNISKGLDRTITAVYERAKMIRFAEFALDSSVAKDTTIRNYSAPVRKPE